MSMKVTITAEIPDRISEIYQDRYILGRLEDSLEFVELPNIDANIEGTFKAKVTSVSTVWVGED